jgi:hypothetical protein
MSLISNEYLCDSHGRFSATVERDGPDCHPCPLCSRPSIWVISAPMGRVRTAEVQRGGVDKPDSPMFLDTRELGEGMPFDQWRAKRDKMYEERRHKEAKDVFG